VPAATAQPSKSLTSKPIPKWMTRSAASTATAQRSYNRSERNNQWVPDCVLRFVLEAFMSGSDKAQLW